MTKRKGDKPTRAATHQLNVLYMFYRGICQRCNKHIPRELASREHKIRLSEGGKSDYDNLTLFCMPCNNEKNEEDYAEERMEQLIMQQIEACLNRQREGRRIVGGSPRNPAKYFPVWPRLVTDRICRTLDQQASGLSPMPDYVRIGLYYSCLDTKETFC